MTEHIINEPGSDDFTFPAAYAEGDKLIFNNTSTGRDGTIIEWEVLLPGRYEITAYGAEGGENEDGYTPGKGARVEGAFEIDAGEIIKILVGQQGVHGASIAWHRAGGGGGGSFVWEDDGDNPLIIAGGGAGNNHTETGDDGSHQEGDGSGGSGSASGAGGAGWDSNGVDGRSNHTGGTRPLEGGYGGNTANETNALGGFGGGGAAANDSGGGGGYQGGDGSNNGGKSFNDGEDTDGESGVREGHGLVEVKCLELPDMPEITEDPVASNIVLGQTLADSTLTGGAAEFESDPVPGTFEFTDPSYQPSEGGEQGVDVTFTPDDEETYAPVIFSISITVLTIDIVEDPEASDIILGQTLGDSTLTGGAAELEGDPVPGTFDFVDPSYRPDEGGLHEVDIIFTPDEETYAPVIFSISITVLTIDIVEGPTATDIVHGETLATSELSGLAEANGNPVEGEFQFTTTVYSRVVFNRRKGVTAEYDQELSTFVDGLPDVSVVDVIDDDEVAGYDFSEVDLLIVGAPDDDWVEHHEAEATIAALEIPVISLCRGVSRNALNMGTGSTAALLRRFTVVDATHPISQALGLSVDEQIDLGPYLVSSHRVSSLAAGATMIMHSGATGSAGLAEIEQEDNIRMHFGFHKFDEGLTALFDLFEEVIRYVEEPIGPETFRPAPGEHEFEVEFVPDDPDCESVFTTATVTVLTIDIVELPTILNAYTTRPLSEATIEGGLAHLEGEPVPGEFHFADPDHIPSKGDLNLIAVLFVPTEEDYAEVEVLVPTVVTLLMAIRYVAPNEEVMKVDVLKLDIVWEDMHYVIDMTVYDVDGNPVEDVTVTFHAQRTQPEVSDVTDGDGEAQVEVLAFDTPYTVTLDHAALGTETWWRILVWGDDVTKQMDIVLHFLGERAPQRDDSKVEGFALKSILWLEPE